MILRFNLHLLKFVKANSSSQNVLAYNAQFPAESIAKEARNIFSACFFVFLFNEKPYRSGTLGKCVFGCLA